MAMPEYTITPSTSRPASSSAIITTTTFKDFSGGDGDGGGGGGHLIAYVKILPSIMIPRMIRYMCSLYIRHKYYVGNKFMSPLLLFFLFFINSNYIHFICRLW